MAIEYGYDRESGTISTVARGVVSAIDISEYVSEVLGRSDIRSGFIEVVDLEGVEDFVFRYTDTDGLKSLWPRFVEKGCVCSIIHAPTDLGFGLMRMLQAVLVDVDAEHPKFHVARTREDVLELIGRERT